MALLHRNEYSPEINYWLTRIGEHHGQMNLIIMRIIEIARDNNESERAQIRVLVPEIGGMMIRIKQDIACALNETDLEFKMKTHHIAKFIEDATAFWLGDEAARLRLLNYEIII